MRFLFILICCCLTERLYCQVAGAEQTAMAGCSIAHTNAFSATNSIAASASTERNILGLHYTNYFLFTEVNAVQLSLAQVLDKGTLSYRADYFGINQFNTLKLGLGYAKPFGKHIAVGLRLNYHRINLIQNQAKNLMSFDLGMVYTMNEKIRLATSLRNPIKQKLEQTFNETLNTEFILGGSFLPNDNFYFSWEFQKDLQLPLRSAIGFSYTLHPKLITRAGISINPIMISGGVGIQKAQLQIDVSSSWHTKLGYSPQISISYAFNKKAN